MAYAFDQEDENNPAQQTNIFDPQQGQQGQQMAGEGQLKTQMTGGESGMDGGGAGGESGPAEGPKAGGNIFKANAGKQFAPKYLQNTFSELNKNRESLGKEKSDYLGKQTNFAGVDTRNLKDQINKGTADWASIQKGIQGGRQAEAFSPTKDYSFNKSANLMSGEGISNVLREETGNRNYSGGEAKLDARLLRKNKAFQDEVANLQAQESEFNSGLNDFGAKAQEEANAKIKQREMENRDNLTYALNNIKDSLIGENKKEAELALKQPRDFSKNIQEVNRGFTAKNKGQELARQQALESLSKQAGGYGSVKGDYRDFIDDREAGILNNLSATLGLKDIYSKGGGARSDFNSARFAEDLGKKTDELYGNSERLGREKYNKLISGIDNIDDSEIEKARKAINEKLNSKYNSEYERTAPNNNLDASNIDNVDVFGIANSMLSEQNPYFKAGRGRVNQAQADEINQLAQMYGFDPIDVAGTGVFDEQGYEAELERRLQALLNPPEVPDLSNRPDLIGRIL